MTKYTFLLPAYKSKYLLEMLESIQHQTCPDYKVIISDDCSPESIRSICSPYLRDSRFVYRRNEKNIGAERLVKHWNILVDLCDTDYLIMASDDDVYETNFLEEIDKLVNKYPEVDLIRARAQIIDGEEFTVRKDHLYYEKADQLDFMLQYEQPCHVTCVGNYVYKTKALKAIGGFVDYPLAWKSDTMTANLLSKNGVANTKDILFNFRVSGLNISSDERKDVLQKKYEATYLKDIDMSRLLKGLGLLELSKLQRQILVVLIRKHIERTISELDVFAVALSFSALIKAIVYFNEKKYFKSKYQIVLLLKKWVYYHIHC